MSIRDALTSSTLSWRAVKGVRPGYDLMDGSDDLATVRAGEVEIGERLFRTEVRKGGYELVEVATGAHVASVRPMTHHVTAINVHTGRYRMSRKGVLPFQYEVTSDYGGPKVLDILRVGSLLRVRGAAQVETAPEADVALLTVLTGMQMLDLLEPTPAAA